MAYVQVLMSHSLPSLGYVWLGADYSDLIHQSNQISDHILHLLPFLGDVKSTIRYASVREVWGDVWQRVGESGRSKAQVPAGVQGSVRCSFCSVPWTTVMLIPPPAEYLEYQRVDGDTCPNPETLGSIA